MSGGLKIQTQVNLAGKSCSFHGIIMATSEEKRILTRMPRHTKFSEIIHRVNLPKKKHKKVLLYIYNITHVCNMERKYQMCLELAI